MVNSAYVLAEQGMWHAGVARTTVAETVEAISRGEVVAARRHGQLVGAIRSRQLNPGTGWFGALAVDGAHGGKGVGAQLVAFAEAQARSSGATTMQLELLVPVHAHPHTERLAAWYARLGYREARRCGLAEVEPDAVPFAAVALEVAVMHKQLASGLGSRAVDAEASAGACRLPDPRKRGRLTPHAEG